jgi:hypothetical protein
MKAEENNKLKFTKYIKNKWAIKKPPRRVASFSLDFIKP